MTAGQCRRSGPVPGTRFRSSGFRAVGPPALALSVLAWGGCGGAPAAPLRVGEPAPRLALPDLVGEMVRLQPGDRPVLISFWATWCQPCLAEIPLLEEVEATGAARVLAVALDEEGAAVVAPFATERSLPYTVLLGDEATFRRFDGLTIPYSLVLDGGLRVRSIHRGRLLPDALWKALGQAGRPDDREVRPGRG